MPTQAQVQTLISSQVGLLQNLFSKNTWNADTLTMRGDIQDAFLLAPEIEDAVAATRAILSSALGTSAAILTPGLVEYARLADTGPAPDKTPWAFTDPQAIITRLARFMDDDGESVVSRNVTFGDPGATPGGSNVGGGTIVQVTEDADGYTIESVPDDEDIKALCISDRNSGSPIQEELFQFQGGAAAIDNLAHEGSGRVQTIKAVSAADSTAFIDNPSFTDFSGTAGTPTAITGWTVASGSIDDLSLNTTVYRSFSGEGSTPYSLKFADKVKITQSFSDLGTVFTTDQPYFVQVAYNTLGAMTYGDLKITIGDSSTTIALDGVGTGWNVARIALDKESWLRTFDKNDATFEIETTESGDSWSGSVLVDDVTIAPMTQWGNGEFYVICGGATPFLLDDDFKWRTYAKAATTGIIQLWLNQAFGRYLPSVLAASSPTWADPS